MEYWTQPDADHQGAWTVCGAKADRKDVVMFVSVLSRKQADNIVQALDDAYGNGFVAGRLGSK